jgi:hypothetical protein
MLRPFQLNGLIVAGQEMYPRFWRDFYVRERGLLREFPSCVRESPHEAGFAAILHTIQAPDLISRPRLDGYTSAALQ